MNNRGKGRGRPSPDAINIKHIVNELEKALTVEDKYMTNLFVVDQNSEEDALLARDSAAQKLRFLKVWFELPSQVFITCINLLDRFLTKMKVKPRYLGCVSVSCLYVASELHKCPLDIDELVNTAKLKCKVSDVERMSDIVRDKLGLVSGEPPITAYTYLTHYLKVLECAATQLNVKSQFSTMIQRKNLLTRLEVVMLDPACASMRPSVAALALIQAELERFLAAEEVPSKSPYYTVEMYQWLTVILELQIISKMAPNHFFACHSKIKSIMQNYDTNERKQSAPMPKFRFSIRMNRLKPSEKCCTHLCVIKE